MHEPSLDDYDWACKQTPTLCNEAAGTYKSMLISHRTWRSSTRGSVGVTKYISIIIIISSSSSISISIGISISVSISIIIIIIVIIIRIRWTNRLVRGNFIQSKLRNAAGE